MRACGLAIAGRRALRPTGGRRREQCPRTPLPPCHTTKGGHADALFYHATSRRAGAAQSEFLSLPRRCEISTNIRANELPAMIGRARRGLIGRACYD